MNLQGSGQRRLQRINVIGGRAMALGIERHTKAIVPENLDEIDNVTFAGTRPLDMSAYRRNGR